MTPGPRDPSMLKHMVNQGRIPPGGTFRPEVLAQRSPPPPLDVSGMSPGPLSVRINGPMPMQGPGGRLNMSPVGGGSGSGGSVSPGNSGTTSQTTRTTPLDQSRDQSSHVTDLSNMSHLSHLSPIPPEELSRLTNKQTPPRLLPKWVSISRSTNAVSATCKGSLTSLGLLSLTSLLLALLALTFLVELEVDNGALRRSSSYSMVDSTVQEVTLALAALTLALDLCCLLVCSAQFVFALKLIKTEGGEERLMKYLQKLSVSRIFAMGSFFVSIPIFLTGVILYTFSQFQRTPAIITAVLIGIGIIFCGLVMIHIVFIWQKEKSKATKQDNLRQGSNPVRRKGRPEMNSSPLPNATLDLSRNLQPHELSTLV